MAIVGNLIARLALDTDEFNRNIGNVQKQMNTAAGKMRGAGMAMSAGITAPLVAGSAVAIAKANELNAALADLSIVGGDADKWTGILQDGMLASGEAVEGVSNAAFTYLSVIGDSAAATADMDAIARGAVAGMTDMETVTAALTTTMAAYGHEAGDAETLIDKFLVAAGNSPATLNDYATALAQVSSESANFGVGLDEQLAVLTSLSQQYPSLSEAATGYKNLMAGMVKPSTQMATLIGELGYASGAAMLEQEGLTESMRMLAAAAETNGVGLESLFGSSEALGAAMRLLGTDTEAYSNLLSGLNDSAGTTDELYARQTEGVNETGRAMQELKSQLEVISQDFGQVLAPALSSALEAAQPLIDGFVRLAEGFTQLDQPMQTSIIAFGAIMAVIGPLALGLSAVISAATALVPIVSALGAALALVLSPVTLIVAALAGTAGLVALMFDLGGANEKVAASLENMGFERAANWVRSLRENTEALWEATQNFFQGNMTLAEFFEIGLPDWIKQLLYVWTWPTLELSRQVINLMSWVWPGLPSKIESLLNKLFRWKWPELSLPGWLVDRMGGADARAAGGVSPGGMTWVGEAGPELVNLPRGATVYPADVSNRMNGAMVNVYATVRNDADVHELARRVAREINRYG